MEFDNLKKDDFIEMAERSFYENPGYQHVKKEGDKVEALAKAYYIVGYLSGREDEYNSVCDLIERSKNEQ